MAPPPEPRRRAPDRAAFTLVELLVVIAIIGILIAIVVPGLGRAQQRGRISTCASNLRQIQFEIRPYTERHGIFPELWNRSSKNENIPALDTVFADASGGTHIYRCPSDRSDLYRTTGNSYFWNILVNRQSSDELFLLTEFVPSHYVPLVADKESFHPILEDKVNILYADGHIAPGLMDYLGAP